MPFYADLCRGMPTFGKRNRGALWLISRQRVGRQPTRTAPKRRIGLTALLGNKLARSLDTSLKAMWYFVPVNYKIAPGIHATVIRER